MCEAEHYEVALRKTDSGFEAVLKLNIGDIKHIQAVVPVASDSVKLCFYCPFFIISRKSSVISSGFS